jgi:AcrR family transcriptional regulator
MKDSSVAVISATRPLRRDAARNRELLLRAAAEVFAEQGLGASVEQVARAAGVGMGTLYRRFPTKQDLVEQLVHDVLTRLAALAREAAAAPSGAGLEQFLRGACALQTDHRGCLPRIWNIPAEHDLAREIRRTIGLLLADAKAHGLIRDEVTDTDITVMLWGLRGIIETTSGADGSAWERHLAILIAGLRPSVVPLASASLSRQRVDRLLDLGSLRR